MSQRIYVQWDTFRLRSIFSQLEQNRESEKSERDREHCPRTKRTTLNFDHSLVFDGQLICRHFLHKIVEYR